MQTDRLNDPAWMHHAYVVERRSANDIARELGCGRTTVRNYLARHDIPMRNTGEGRRGCTNSIEQRAKQSATMKARWAAHPATDEFKVKISTTKTIHGRHPGGYQWIYVPGKGRILEHRHIMEVALGRPLRSDEIVHHLDDDPLNNALDNLALESSASHGRIHHATRKRDSRGRYQ